RPSGLMAALSHTSLKTAQPASRDSGWPASSRPVAASHTFTSSWSLFFSFFLRTPRRDLPSGLNSTPLKGLGHGMPSSSLPLTASRAGASVAGSADAVTKRVPSGLILIPEPLQESLPEGGWTEWSSLPVAASHTRSAVSNDNPFSGR